MKKLLEKYFPDLEQSQINKLCRLEEIYNEWNRKINVISRKDMENFNVHHVLHSLSIARFTSFAPGTEILDIGTGGGFPGIPLSVVFPASRFVLLDSIQKKIRVVNAILNELDIKNSVTICSRAETHKRNYDFIISRAVATFPELVKLSAGKIKTEGKNSLKNGIITLKGGDLSAELKKFSDKTVLIPISRYFDEPYFETKFLIYMPFEK